MTFPSLGVLADVDVDPTTGHGPEWGKAAPVALLIILLMAVALYFLIRSMNKHLKKVPKTFVALAAGTPAVADDLQGAPADSVNADDAAIAATTEAEPTAADTATSAEAGAGAGAGAAEPTRIRSSVDTEEPPVAGANGPSQ